MKYIKLFESFIEYKDEDIDICRDAENILQDCKDLSLYVAVYEPFELQYSSDNFFKSLTEYKYGIAIYIEHNPDIDSEITYKFSDIKENIEHLVFYMNDKGYKTYYYRDVYVGFNQPYHNKNYKVKENYLPKDTDSIGVIKIVFLKK